MKTLHLLRHAKSDQDGTRDFRRPLSKRGISAAKTLAKHIDETALDVDQVFCSSARRTRQTYDIIEGALADAPVAFDDALYLADVETLLGFIQELPAIIGSAMIIGHNPGLHELASSLAHSAKSAPELEAVRAKFPTGALCSLEFRGSWKDVRPSTGRLTAFVRPRDLE